MNNSDELSNDKSPDNHTSDETVRDRPEYETVDEETRKTMLERYDYRCQNCGDYGQQKDGLATLEIHHLDRNPDRIDVHDPANLTVLCRSCHTWYHQQPDPDEVPVDLNAADKSVMLRQDREILQLLAANGPMRTGNISDQLSVDQTPVSIRERLWQLMGIDAIVEGRERPLVDKDIETGEWGLPGQIEHSVRGDIPSETKTLLQRMEDELVRQALERGCDRETVAEVFDVARRTTFTKEKRARAYKFPLEALNNGGRPPKSQPDDGSPQSARSDKATASESSDGNEAGATTSDTVKSAAQSADEAEMIDGLDEDALDEIWDEHHSALHPDNRDPEIAALAAKSDLDQLQDQLPDGISPVQLLNATLIASQT